jgi:uncharacterized damage-inducible protein DinB
MELEQLRFPVGKFEYGKTYTTNETRKHLKDIAGLPSKVKKICKKLSGNDLDTPYRPEGWTARQVVHHLADSHINAYIRTKLLMTEVNPTIKPYMEELWAETEDGKHGSIKMSLKLLKSVHQRWVSFLESLTEEDFHKTYYHPGSNRVFTLAEVLALYSWHGKHHLGHLKIVEGGKKPKKVKKAKIKKVMIVGEVEKKEEKKDKDDKKSKAKDTVIIIPAKSLKADPPVKLPNKIVVSTPVAVAKSIATKKPAAPKSTITKVEKVSAAKKPVTTIAKTAKATPTKKTATTVVKTLKTTPVKKATPVKRVAKGKETTVTTEITPGTTETTTTSADGRITTTTRKIISSQTTVVPTLTTTKKS